MRQLLAERRKALIALPVPLVGGLLALYPDSHYLAVCAVIITALATALGVHQIPNAPPRAEP